MSILYTISVVSFCVLVWAAFAIARHIRRASSASLTRAQATQLEADAPVETPHRRAS
jgi:hypothetical protein